MRTMFGVRLFGGTAQDPVVNSTFKKMQLHLDDPGLAK